MSASEPKHGVPPVAATPLDEVDAQVERLYENRDRWVAVDIPTRVAILRQCADHLAEVAEEWAKATSRNRGLDPNTHEGGEAWLTELAPTMRSIRLLRLALEAGGQPKIPRVRTRPDGQKVATVFPTDTFDKIFFSGMRTDVWLQPGKDASQGALYRDKRAGKIKEGAVALVLGAGNVGSICPTDVLYKLFCDDEVVIIKTNPVNAFLGPFWEHMLKPLVAQGFAAVVYGAAEVGIHLCNHPRVSSIHITGSDKTYDAIVWGGDPAEQARRKASGERQNTRPVSAELGCVTPVFIVPGQWSRKDMEYQATNIVSMMTNNASFNCVAAKVLVTATGWAQRDAFLEIFKRRLAAAAPRKAYYPGAEQRYAAFIENYPAAEVLGAAGDGVVPWTFVPQIPAKVGEYALSNEAFCGVIGQVDLDADTASDFLRAAASFGNEAVWGTLSCTFIVDPKTAKREAAALDRAVAELNYGAISVNLWSGVIFGHGSPPWGAAPGHPPEDIQSGVDHVHNTYLLDYPEKTVFWAPFRVRPSPAWFDGARNAQTVGRRFFKNERKPSFLAVPGIISAALRG